MKFSQLLLNASLLLLMKVNIIICEMKPIDFRLSKKIVPSHYEIFLNTSIVDRTITAETDITLEIHSPTFKIELHGINFTISQCQLIDRMTTHMQEPQIISSYELERIRLLFENNVPSGYYTLNIKYELYVSYIEEDKRLLLVTSAGFNGARKVFPCFDEPAFKATFNISIVHSERYKVFSSVPGRVLRKNDTLITNFVTPKLSTYLVGIMIINNIGPTYKDIDNIITSTWSYYTSSNNWDLTYARDMTHKIGRILMGYRDELDRNLHIYEETLTYDIVVIPGKFPTIQKWGLIVYSKDTFIYDDVYNIWEGKMKVVSTIAREMAYQLIGNIVSPSWWTHAWLHEGLATFFEFYPLSNLNIFNPSLEMDIFIVYPPSHATRSHIDFPFKNVTYHTRTQDIKISSSILHHRVPFLLRMLRDVINNEKEFYTRINRYLADYKFKPATPEDLWANFQNISDRSKCVHGYIHDCNLRKAIDGCLIHTNYPVVTATKNYQTGITHIFISHFKEDLTIDWTIPISIISNSTTYNANFTYFWLTPIADLLENTGADNDTWIIVNSRRIGYYRVYYDTTNWKSIAHFLKHDRYRKLDLFVRAQIIDDAYHFMKSREISFQLFLDIISCLKYERDFEVWYSATPMLEYIWDLCKDSYFKDLKNFMSTIWDSIFKDVNYGLYFYEDQPIVKTKQAFCLEWACKFGYDKCRTMATDQLLDHFNTDTYYPPPRWSHWVYCTGMMTVKSITWNSMMRGARYYGEDILEYLACSEDENIIFYYLRMLSSKNLTTYFQDAAIYRKAYSKIVEKHAENTNVLCYILHNLRNLKPSTMSTIELLDHLISNVYSENNVYTIMEYLKDRAYLYRDVLREAERLMKYRLSHIRKDVLYFSLSNYIE